MARKVGSVVLALIALALGSVAQASKSRTVTGEYNTLIVQSVPDQPQGSFSNGVRFGPHKGERFVSIVLEDKSGNPAYAILSQDLDGDGVGDTEHEICGATESPIAFEPGIKIRVSAQEGVCGGEPMASTLGTVTATFTR